MDKISEQLIELSDMLDQSDNTKCANIIDELIERQSLTKVAQYVGIIGYVLKQNRAMGNCIRKKRASATESIQESVLGCLKEYQDGQQYDNNEWTSKYAQVVQQCPNQFMSSHEDFINALSEENNMDLHINRVKKACSILSKKNVQNNILNQIISDLNNLNTILKEADENIRPFKLAAPQSPRSRWSRFWNPSWSRGGKDKDTQFEMDAVLKSLMNIQNDIQQIRGGISQLRYQSRSTQDLAIQQHLQSLSDTNWEQTTRGIHGLQQALSDLQQSNSADEAAVILVQSSSQIEENIEQVFDEIKNVQKNMYNLRLRDPIKGRGSLKSATEEYSDLARTLDRLYINPLNERALHYSLKLHGRLEDTLNERASNIDPNYNEWINAPESELGRSRVDMQNEDFSTKNPSMTMDPSASPIENNLMKMIEDPGVLKTFVDWLKDMQQFPTPNKPEVKDAIRYLLGMLQEKQNNFSMDQPQSNVVQTNNSTPENPQQNWSSIFADPNSDLQNFAKNTPITGSNVKKMIKIADILDDWNNDLAELLREYIENEESNLPNFPSTSSIIKERVSSK